MKKLLVLLFIPLLFTSCAKVSASPVIPTSFKRNAAVMFNEVEFQCEICREDTSKLTVTFLEPDYMQGMIYFCEGETVTLQLDHMNYQISPDELSDASFIISLTSVLNSMTRVKELKAAHKDSGYEYTGSCRQGSFKVTQNKDYDYETIKLNDNLIIDFT